MGPVLGSLIYSNLGFGATFWVIGGMMGPVAILILLTLPKPVYVKERRLRNRNPSLNHDEMASDRAASKVLTVD